MTEFAPQFPRMRFTDPSVVYELWRGLDHIRGREPLPVVHPHEPCFVELVLAVAGWVPTYSGIRPDGTFGVTGMNKLDENAIVPPGWDTGAIGYTFNGALTLQNVVMQLYGGPRNWLAEFLASDTVAPAVVLAKIEVVTGLDAKGFRRHVAEIDSEIGPGLWDKEPDTRWWKQPADLTSSEEKYFIPASIVWLLLLSGLAFVGLVVWMVMSVL